MKNNQIQTTTEFIEIPNKLIENYDIAVSDEYMKIFAYKELKLNFKDIQQTELKSSVSTILEMLDNGDYSSDEDSASKVMDECEKLINYSRVKKALIKIADQ